MSSATPSTSEFYDAPSRTATGILETPEDVEMPDIESIQQLQTQQQAELLDTIDELRSLGLNHHGISLPQLIVCGDQSSGKSSLLDGLTRLRFPTKGAGACTKFATEVVLRKAANEDIKCTITSAKSRSDAQRRKLLDFKYTYESREAFNFPEVIREATNAMAFRQVDEKDVAVFFDDVLRITYYGPDLPSLTVVDLPGLFGHSATGGGVEPEVKSKTKSENAKKVTKMVQSYMQNPKSVILAVVAAQYDTQHQNVLEYAEQFDPEGNRTLGIVTKPDRADGDERAQVISMVKNKRIAVKYGWHVVKNRGSGQEMFTDIQRDEAEENLFATGDWATLPKEDVGIANLRTKLSCVLFEHIGNEIGDVVKTIQTTTKETQTQLKGLGIERATSAEQRTYLTGHAERFQILTSDALRGIYTNPFFDLTTQNKTLSIRLRTEIQNLNIAFAQTMYSKGHTWHISDRQPNNIPSPLAGATSSHILDEYDAYFPDEPEWITRSDFLENNIGEFVRQSRPSGLPSLVNPWVIGEVFRQQSKNWAEIAEMHLRRVWECVQMYTQSALGSLDQRTNRMIMMKKVQPELDRRLADVEAKLKELLVPYTEQDPITYDPNFVREIEETRKARYQALLSQDGTIDANNRLVQQRKFGSVQRPTGHLLSDSIDGFTNSEILDLMQTYYKHAISIFINNIAVLAVENCLIKDLSGIFSPMLIANLSNDELEAIAAESPESKAKRESLKQKIDALQKGKRILNTYRAMKPSVQKPKPTASGPRVTLNNHRPHTPEPRQGEQDEQSALDNLMNGMNKLVVTPPASESGRSSSTPTGSSYKGEALFNKFRQPVVADEEDDDEDL